MVNFFSQDLFCDVFAICLVCINVKVEGHGQEEDYTKGALVFGGHIEGGKWRPAQFELSEEILLDCGEKEVLYTGVRVRWRL